MCGDDAWIFLMSGTPPTTSDGTSRNSLAGIQQGMEELQVRQAQDASIPPRTSRPAAGRRPPFAWAATSPGSRPRITGILLADTRSALAHHRGPYFCPLLPFHGEVMTSLVSPSVDPRHRRVGALDEPSIALPHRISGSYPHAQSRDMISRAVNRGRPRNSLCVRHVAMGGPPA